MSEDYDPTVGLFSPASSEAAPEPPADAAPAKPEGAEAAAEPAAAAPAEPVQGTERDAQGRFVAKPADAAPAAPAAPAPPAQPDANKPPEGQTVPLAALHEERTKRQKAEEALEATRRPTAPAPDPAKDPDGYRQFVEGQAFERVFNFSQAQAVEKHGKDTTDQALAWADERATRDPVFARRIFTSDNPVADILKERQQHQNLERLVSLPPEQLDRILSGQAAPPDAQHPPANPSAAPNPAPTPPRTIMDSPSAAKGGAGSVPVGPDEPFNALPI